MAVRAEDLDRWQDEVVAESIVHSELSILIYHLVGWAVAPEWVAVSNLGITWGDGTRSAPDTSVLRADEVNRQTTSHRIGAHGSPPRATVEVVVDSGPDLFAMVRRRVPVYLLSPEPADVLRFDPATGVIGGVADGEPCPELGGVAFRRTAVGLAVIDHLGREWTDPQQLVRGSLGA